MCTPIDEANVLAYAQDYRNFIVASPSSFHAAAEAARQLEAAGFRRQEDDEQWDATPGGHYLVRGGAVMAWRVPEGAGPHSEFRVVGAHTDSPSFHLKPNPDRFHYGFSQVNVETYGGLLLNSWLNRDLGIAGRLTTIDGEDHLFATGPIMFIPQLAPHLDRSVDQKLELNRQTSLQPIWATGEKSVLEYIAQEAGVDPEQVGGIDGFAYDTQAPALVSGEFIASGRQDNLSSTYAGLAALLASKCPEIAVFAAFDHEEVGSSTSTGAAGPILEQVLRRTAYALGASEEQFYQMIARSSCISADAGHSINPNYPGYHDPSQYPVMGGGAMIKINANQRYASDSRGQSLWLRACHEAGEATQEFVSNNAVPCGTTIGPITATRLGIETVDVGVPLLSMHSVREVSSARDNAGLSAILRGYWNLA